MECAPTVMRTSTMLVYKKRFSITRKKLYLDLAPYEILWLGEEQQIMI
jgi:hypothetical protein